MIKKGIDVSVWDGNIDFNAVKTSGIDFVIIRAGYGSHSSGIDKLFEQNYYRAKKANLNVGAYWYSYAKSTKDALLEANTCMNAIKGKQFDYPIYLDVEEPYFFTNGKEFCDSIITTFCNELEKYKYFTGFYMSLDYLKEYVSPTVSSRYSVWVADYANKLNYNGPYGIWQYTSNGSVNGIQNNCDLDYGYVDFPSIIMKGGFNGYLSSNNTPPSSDIDSIAREVIDGKWGNGEERKKRLTAAGYNYNEVQKRVNELLQ